MWNCWVVSVSGPHLFFLLLCCSIPASGSTLAAFPLSVRSCSAELSFSSMVQCSVVCCLAADMSSPLSSSPFAVFPLDAPIQQQQDSLQLQSPSPTHTFFDSALLSLSPCLFLALILTSPFIFLSSFALLSSKRSRTSAHFSSLALTPAHPLDSFLQLSAPRCLWIIVQLSTVIYISLWPTSVFLDTT